MANQSPTPFNSGTPCSRHRNPGTVVGVVLGLALVAGGGFFWWRFAPQSGLAEDAPDSAAPAKPAAEPLHPLFQGWKKPDLVLVLSGQMKGYLQPCGCSSPQLGGLARRYNFLKSLEAKGWPVAAIDLGDLAQTKGPHDQALLKYETALKALQLMNYTAVGLAKSEFDLSLGQAIPPFALNEPKPAILAANLLNRQQNFPDMIKDWEIADKTAPRVGVVGLIAKSLRDRLIADHNPEARFAPDIITVLQQALKELGQKKVELGVLLLQGREFEPFKEKADPALEEARTCADMMTAWKLKQPALAPVYLILRITDQAEPPATPLRHGDVSIFTVGHKGRFVGVLGVYRNPKGFDFKYELVSIGPEYDTPKGKESTNPVMGLMEEYTKEVKRKGFMAQFGHGEHPVQRELAKKGLMARYIGSERCGDCHDHAYNIWQQEWGKNKLSHSHAYATLVNKADRPSLRQFDGECIVCHTVGFEYKTGYYDKAHFNQLPPKRAAKLEDLLRNVGCESCHGPASEHEKNPRDKDIHKLINPYKAAEKEKDPKTPQNIRQALYDNRMTRIDISCQKCHDLDNDVDWKFKEQWPKIIHMNPPPKNQKAAPAQKAP